MCSPPALNMGEGPFIVAAPGRVCVDGERDRRNFGQRITRRIAEQRLPAFDEAPLVAGVIVFAAERRALEMLEHGSRFVAHARPGAPGPQAEIHVFQPLAKPSSKPPSRVKSVRRIISAAPVTAKKSRAMFASASVPARRLCTCHQRDTAPGSNASPACWSEPSEYSKRAPTMPMPSSAASVSRIVRSVPGARTRRC